MRPFVPILLAAGMCALAVAACSGPAALPAPNGSIPMRSGPTKNTTATPSPIPFVYQTLDDPNSNTNQVNGINQLSKVVGTYGAGQSSNIEESYETQPPYSVFRAVNDPGAQGTVATSLSSNFMQAGYVTDPRSLNGTWAFVRIKGLWTLLSAPNEGSGSNAVTEIWGLNDSGYAVGYYLNASGLHVPFELDIPTESFTDLKPPGSRGAAATGITGRGDIAGWENTANGIKGFFLRAGTYYPFSYPSASRTYALSVNWQDQVAGYYVSGKNAPHGFILTYPMNGGGRQVWQSIEEPKAARGTWVTGINNHDDICGYYIDGSGVQHGFLAVPK